MEKEKRTYAERKYFSSKEICEIYGISASTFYKLKRMYPELFPKELKVGVKNYRYSLPEFEEFLRKINEE